MSEDNETPEEVPLNHEQIEAVVNWAIGAAATVAIMHHSAEAEDLESMAEKLVALQAATERLHDSVPDCIHDLAHYIAKQNLDAALEEEELVEKFRDELDGL